MALSAEVDFMDFNYLTIDPFVTQPGKFFEWAKGNERSWNPMLSC